MRLVGGICTASEVNPAIYDAILHMVCSMRATTDLEAPAYIDLGFESMQCLQPGTLPSGSVPFKHFFVNVHVECHGGGRRAKAELQISNSLESSPQ